MKYSIILHLVIIFGCLATLITSNVNVRKKFRTCADSQFCRRYRSFIDNQAIEQLFYYWVEPTQIQITSNEIFGVLVNSNSDDYYLRFKLSMYEGGILRVIIDDVIPKGKHKRFRTSTTMGFEFLTLNTLNFTVVERNNERIVIQTTQQDKANPFRGSQQTLQERTYKYVIKLKSFKIEAYLDDQLMMVANGNQFFNFEYERTPQDHFKIFNRVPFDATYKFQFDINDQNQFTEMFEGYVDTMIFGPRAIGMDFEFAQDQLFGIPEHAMDFNLPDTLYIENNSEPYRLYNIDMFPYQLNSTQALYGSIPYLLAHQSRINSTQDLQVKGNVGLYWSNAAETWVDLYSTNSPLNPRSIDTPLKRGAIFNSESGVLEFIIIMGINPEQVTSKWADVSGHAPLTPYWSLGYHQSRWSYESASEAINVNFKFDQHGLPLDVLWFDIDHTNEFEYFTWNPTKFSNESLEQMNEILESRLRKAVVIQDPHIKKQDSYYIYQGLLGLEEQSLKKDEENHQISPASGKYLVRDPLDHDKAFVGRCWPGDSVWIDFIQLKARQFWAALYQYDLTYKISKNYFVWNDMNEPSVLDKPELTMPKNAIHYTDQGQMIENREVHNLYGALMHQSTYYGLVLRNEGMNLRSFVLSRSFYAGSQKFGAVWTGDNGSEYQDLKMSVQMLLSMSIAGLGFVGADIGGFASSTPIRILVQWHNLGMFYPFMRQHCHKETKKREPYLYKGEGFNQIQKSLRQRQRMLPYIYTKFYEYHRFGVPLMRPMFMEFPDLEYSSLFNDQYMFGDIFLVKPDEEQSSDQPSTVIYLPQGTWYDFYTNIQYKVEHTGLYRVNQESGNYIYVFAKGGTILPQKENVKMSALLAKQEPYLLNIYLDQDFAEGYLYLDDGETFDYLKKQIFKIIQFQYTNGVIKGKTIEGDKYQSQYERVGSLQVIGIENFTQIADQATVQVKKGDQWIITKTVQVEKLEEFKMVVILDLDVDLMNEEWQIDIKLN